MTREEIFLINQLIKESVKSVVKETIREEFDKLYRNDTSVTKKDIKEVKLLLAKAINESRSVPQSRATQPNTGAKKQFKKAPVSELKKFLQMGNEDLIESDDSQDDSLNEQVRIKRPKISAAMAKAMENDPQSFENFEVPIPEIDYNSEMMQALMDKVGGEE